MIEVIFEVGEKTEDHSYPSTFSWTERGRFIAVLDENANVYACYLSERVICIRRKVEKEIT